MAGGKKVLVAAIVVVGLAYYARLMGRNLCDVAGGSDSSGYVNYAWRLRHGPLTEKITAVDTLGLTEEFVPFFQPLGFTWGAKGPQGRTNVPLYPPGLPLHMVVLAELLGWRLGPFLVSPIAALACLLLMYALSRQFGLSPPWSLAAAAVLAAFPVFLFQAVQPMSDVLATAWGLAAVLAGLLARKRPGWAWLAGAALGLNVLVRPTNALLLFPLAFALPPKPKVYVRFILGGIVFALAQAALDQALYGNPFVTGYGGEQLTSAVFPLLGKNIIQFARWLIAMATIVFPLGWLLTPANRRLPRRDRWLLMAWFAPFFFLYGIFDFITLWTYVRYLLPGIPAVILGGMLWLRDGTAFAGQKIRSARRFKEKPPAWLVRVPAVVAGLLCFFILRAQVHEIRSLHVLDADEFEAVYKVSCLATKDAIPERSVVLASQLSGALTYYTKLIPCKWEGLTPETFNSLRQKTAFHGYGLFALLFPFEEAEFRKNAPGPWEKIAAYKFITLWKCPGP